MKRLITLFLLFFMSFGLFAQVDVTIGTGTVQNLNTDYPAPYGNWYWGARHQFIIPAAEIIAAGGYAGNILALAFDVAAVQGIPLQNFEIRMGTTTATSLATWEPGPFAQHHLTPLYTEVLGWNTHTFSTPFYWDGTSSLIVESCFNNSAYTYNAVVNQTTTTYTSTIEYHGDNANVCSTTGTTSFNQRPNMKLTFAPNTPLDAGISAINSPVPPVTPGSHAVTATLNNYGTDTLTSCTVNWSVNGVLQAPYAWTGSLPSTQATAPLPLGSFNFPQGNNTIKVWSSAPNNGTDGFNGNDTNEVSYYFSTPLSGTYTIGSSTSADFPSFNTALNIANASGLGGPVIFEAEPGIYNEKLILNEIIGSSATNTVTFKSSTNNSADVILEYMLSSTSDAILMFDAAKYYTFSFMTFRTSPGSAAGRIVQFTNSSNYNNLLNNVIETEVSTSSSYAGIYTSSSSNDNYNIIANNHIKNGYYGIYWYGPSSSNRAIGNVFENNTIENTYYYGMYTYYNDSLQIIGNKILPGSNISSTYYGYYIYYTYDGFNIVNNEFFFSDVTNSTTMYGLRIYYGNYYSETLPTHAPGMVYNNTVSIINSGTKYGMYLYYNNNTKFYHNSVYLSGGGSTSRPLYRSNTTSNTIGEIYANNIFVDNVGEYAAYFASTTSLTSSDNNVYYTKGGNIAYWSGAKATLADLQTASSMEANSIQANPVFASPTNNNLTPVSITVDNAGAPVGILTDIYGITRSTTTPDVGAVEFTTSVSADLALIGGELVNGECLSANDSVYITIENVVGPTVNFSTATTTVHWSVTGPMTSSGTITINSGTLASATELTVGGSGVDMSLPGTYHLSAYISANAVNVFAANDTLNEMSSLMIYDPFYVTPKHVVITNPNDTAEISANSTFFPSGAFLFTEICQYAGTSTGQPTGGKPSFLGDDYIEITGVPNSDLAGYVVEKWQSSGTAPTVTHTFPAGSYLSPTGTFLLSTYQGTASPQDYHQVADVTASYSSTTSGVNILKDPNGNIVDVVLYGTSSTIPAATGVTTQWTGAGTDGGSSWGIRLIGPDTDNNTNWVKADGSPQIQDPGTLNTGVPLPSPAALTGFTWSHNGVVTSNNVIDTVVGPWSTSGVYHYVASYVTPCGTLTDTVTVHVAFINILQGDTTICQGDTAMISLDLPGTGPWTVVGTDGTGVDTMTVTSLPWISYVNPPVTTTFTLLSYADASNMFLNVNIPVTITVIPGPTVTLPAYSPVCIGDSAFILTGGMPSGGTYGGPGVAAGVFDPFAAGTGTHFVTYTYADPTTGCSSTAAEQIFVDGGPDGTLTADHDICEGESTTLEFITPGGGSPTVIFSEYIEGTSNNKAIEIFNATPDTVDLADYRIGQSVNGGGWAYWHYFPTGAMLAPYTTWVMVADQVSSTYYDTAYADEVLAYPSVVHHNGDDARSVEITNDGGLTWTIIDIIGDPDNDPGTGWPVAGINNATADNTLIRKPEIFAGNTNWAAVAGTDSLSSEYTVYPVNYFADLGSHTFIPPAGGNYTYAWSTGATTQSITVSPTVTTTYTVTVSSPGSTCDNIQMVVVTVNPAPAVNLGADFDVCDDGTATIDAGAGFASYMWSTGATTHAITVSGATIGLGNTATFTVTVTDANGCEGISSVNVTAIDCSNINDPDMKSALTFWPNPNDGNFFIRIKGITGDATLRISNVTGQTISVENLTLNDEWVKEFSLGNLAPGIYFVRLNTKTDVVTKQIIIK